MIRLRRAVDRGLAHRWLRIALLILLAGFMAFVVLHGTNDVADDGATGTCLAVTILLFAVVMVPSRETHVTRFLAPHQWRGPPSVVPGYAGKSERAPLTTPLRR